MNEQIKLSVIGGDMRQSVVAELLSAAGFKCSCFALPRGADGLPDPAPSLDSCLESSAAVILGVPFSSDGRQINCKNADFALSLRSICERLAPRGLLLGGRVTPEAQATAALYGVRFVDYLEREEVNIHNAVPTAEGALAIAMNELAVTLCGSHTAVLGYGRIGRVLAERLRAMGARVTVAVRKSEDEAWCRLSGFEVTDFGSLCSLRGASVIFNTVPARVLGRRELEGIGPESLYIDLASRPGGVDMESARELGCRVIWALSLPGKVAFRSAGEIIAKSVISILHEEGIA